ncbi:MAG: hypothetical protein L6R36_003636 [Xanthoria steineri]|nr:MAG: hypothetical protein L6R36_003636 [Xanthoria steineri]
MAVDSTIEQQLQERRGIEVPGLQFQDSNAANSPVEFTDPSRYTFDNPPVHNGYHSCNSAGSSKPSAGRVAVSLSPKLLSPTFLDPSLILDTTDKVFQRYYSRKAEIEKMHYENELQLNQYLTGYGQSLGPADIHALDPSFQHNQQPLPAFQTLPNYQPQSSVGNDIHFNDGYDHDEENRPTAYPYELGIHQDDRGDEPNEQAKLFRQLPAHPSTTPPQTTTEAGASSEKAAAKKRPSKKGSAKKPVWYAPQLEVANLPTSGLVKKRRRRLGDEVPQPGFNVPSGNIHGIFATGLPVRFVGPGPNPYLAGGGAAVADGSGGEPPVKGERKAKVARMI